MIQVSKKSRLKGDSMASIYLGRLIGRKVLALELVLYLKVSLAVLYFS